jgi:Fe-S oxidoreductase/nitrate reductase gamma subunit
MPNRPDFWGIEPEWVHYLIYVILTAALLVMLVKVFRQARYWWKIGRPENRIDQPIKRFIRFLSEAFVHRRILTQPYAGIMHFLIAWSMIILFLGTPVGIINAYVFPGFLKGSVFLVFKLLMDICVITFLIGAGMAAYRRFVIRPEKLTFESKFEFSLILLTLIIITGPIIEGTRLSVLSIEESISYGSWMPVGWGIAQLFLNGGGSVSSIHMWHSVFYYFHMGLVIVAFLTLPTGSLIHIITTPLNVFFSKLQPMGQLAAAEEDADHSLIFADRLENLTWKQLMDGDACTECGRCQEDCPANAVGFDLNPKQVILNIRNALHRDGAAIIQGDAPSSVQLVGETIPTDTLWACTTCGACVSECPAFIDHISDIVSMRRHLVNEGEVDEMLQTSLASLGRYGNSFGKSGRLRAKWAKDLEFEIKNAVKEPVEYLWFVGDYASFSPSLQDITIKTAKVLQAAGVDFGILYDKEKNAGNDVRRVGEEGLFEVLVEDNCKVIQKADFKTIITTDPHSYNTLKNEYPDEVINGRPILHYSELLVQLITSGKLKLKKGIDLRVTYHDPCYLARYHSIFEAPRSVIRATGCTLVEMPRNRNHGFCCGAGGGRIYLDEGVVKERPSENRVKEAAVLEDVSTFVVACPKDITMFQDALKTTSLEDKLEVKDLIELVYDALKS